MITTQLRREKVKRITSTILATGPAWSMTSSRLTSFPVGAARIAMPPPFKLMIASGHGGRLVALREAVMQVLVIGSGYVGLVAAACFAEAGYRILGVDVDVAKVATLSRGESPIFEPGLEELLK